MLLTSLLVVVFIAIVRGDTTEEAPFVIATKDSTNDQKVSNLLPDLDVPLILDTSSRGRSDIEIEQDKPFTGYFYPKPAKPFNLPEFKTLNPDASVASFEGEESYEEVERSPRSPRRPPYFRPGFIPPSNNNIPPFIPGFIPPHNIRPLPALYGR